MKFFVKIKNLFNYSAYLLTLFILPAKKEIKPNTLLIARLDAIGDYILFRNFLQIIKESRRFKNYSITLCGNILWKDLAETLDKEYVDDFIWIHRQKFYSNIKYKYSVLKKIRLKGFETAIDMAYSREILFGDSIIRASNARIRIGSEGAKDSHVVWKRKLFSKNIYTEIIPAENEDVFEFNRNKEYGGKILQEKTSLEKPAINISDIHTDKITAKPYAVLFIGASSIEKIWDKKNFLEIARFLIDRYSLNIVLVGGEKEKTFSDFFIKNLPGEKAYDFCGATTLPELIKIISGSEILISNESAAVHMSAAVNKKFICISNGERIIRFHPYPEDIFDKAYYVYPDEIFSNLNNWDFLGKFRFSSNLDINSVSPENVKKVITQVI